MRRIAFICVCLISLATSQSKAVACTGCGTSQYGVATSSYEGVAVCGECVHFVDQYVLAKYGVTLPALGADGGACLFWTVSTPGMDKIAYNGSNYPQYGDVLIYSCGGSLPYGHCAIVVSATSRSSVTVVESNWCTNDCQCGDTRTLSLSSSNPGWLRYHNPCVAAGTPSLDGAADGGWYSLGTQFTLYAYDNGGTAPITTRIWVDNIAETGWTSGNSLPLGALPSGSYTWHGQKYNCGGYSGEVTRTFHVNYPPGQPSLSAPADGSLVANCTVSLSWSDPGDPDNWPNNCRDYRIHVWNPTSGWNYDSGWGYTPTSTHISVPGDGQYRWQVAAGDGANDQGYCTDRGFTVDTVAPAISLSGPATSCWFNKASGPQSVIWGATDATSGVDSSKTTLTWDNGVLTNASPAQIPEGKRTATVRATDNAGNSASQTFGPWWVDTAPPIASVALNPASPNGQNGWYTTNPTLSVSAIDPNGADASGVKNIFYTLDNGSETPFTSPVLISSDGIHTYSARATDVAGNSGTTGNQTIRADTTAPVFESVSTDAESRSLSTLVATWSCSDPDSGVAQYQYWIGTQPGWNDVKDVTSAGNNNWAYVVNLSLSPGQTYYFSIHAQNTAGLWSGVVGSQGILAVEGEQDASPTFDAGGVSVLEQARISTNYKIKDSVGQFVVGGSSSGNFLLEHGYWHSDNTVLQAVTPGAAKAAADGITLQLGSADAPMVVTSGTSTFSDRFCVEEPGRSSGIAVQYGAAGGPALVEGDQVWLIGKISTINDERIIQFASPTIIGHVDPLSPVYMSVPNIGGGVLNTWTPGVVDGVGLNNIGLLIKTLGGVVCYRDPQGRFFYVDNGDNLYDGSHYGMRIICDGFVGGAKLAMPAYSSRVVITGISSLVMINNQPVRAIHPRRQSDIQVMN